jgi:hypothetical protein
MQIDIRLPIKQNYRPFNVEITIQKLDYFTSSADFALK